jgi:hypothetical protein
MIISVRSRTGRNGKEPSSFCLGRRELFVTGILDRTELTGARRFQVRVADGRRFVIRHQAASDQWELAAVYSRRQAGRSAAARHAERRPGRSLIALLATSLRRLPSIR